MSRRPPSGRPDARRPAPPAAPLPAVLAVALLVLPAPLLAQALDSEPARGPLDRPLSLPAIETSGPARVSPDVLGPAPGVSDLDSLRRAVRAEQRLLERLDRRALERRARRGERAAQVALGIDFAKEAQSLAFAPAAANAATSDALRWYSLAASSGFPGAPSLDTAGVRLYPIRVQRGSSGR